MLVLCAATLLLLQKDVLHVTQDRGSPILPVEIVLLDSVNYDNNLVKNRKNRLR